MRRRCRFVVLGYVVMPEHIHLLLSEPQYDTFSPVVQALQYDQAIQQYRRTLELDPNFITVHGGLGSAYLHKSLYKEGIAEFEKELAISPHSAYVLAGLGYAYGGTGKRTEAQKVLDQLNQLSKQEYVPAVYRAQI
jgi:tetratricopeptide (TPR) repeat protein